VSDEFLVGSSAQPRRVQVITGRRTRGGIPSRRIETRDKRGVHPADRAIGAPTRS